MIAADPKHQHQTTELRFLFKHFLLFFVITYTIRFINGYLFSSIGWSNPIVYAWGVIILIHFVAFLMSLGVIGIEWEGKTSMEIILEFKTNEIDPYIEKLKSIVTSSNKENK